MKIFIVIVSILFMFSCKKKSFNNDEIDKSPKELSVKKVNNNKDSIKTILNYLNEDFVLGKFNYKIDTLFVKADLKHTYKTLYLQKEVYNAFIKMSKAAKADSITLKIISGTRNFNEQKAIWNRKWKRYNNLEPKELALKILEYSSMPSTSRHHWGTDLDLNNLNNTYFESGDGKIEYDWLVANAGKFGFFQPYTSKENGRTGYQMEKWHWSYKPLAAQYLSFYNNNISYNDISGFSGSEFAIEVKVIENYVNGTQLKN